MQTGHRIAASMACLSLAARKFAAGSGIARKIVITFNDITITIRKIRGDCRFNRMDFS